MIFLSFIIENTLGKTNFDDVRSILNNLQSHPLLELTIKNNLVCPQGFIQVQFGFWPGLLDGCDCSYSADVILKGACSVNLKNLCETLSEVTGANYSYWKGNSYCGKYSESNYGNIRLVKNSLPCSEGLKKCGEIDTKGNELCVNQNEPCPIYDLVFQSNSNLTAKEDRNSSSLRKNKAIIEFKVSESLPCVQNHEESTPNLTYILEKNIKTSCGKNYGEFTFDPRFELLDEISYESLLIQNGFYKYYFSNSSVENRTKKLYSRAYIGFDIGCQEKLKNLTGNSVLQTFEKISFFSAKIVTFSFIFQVFSICYFFVLLSLYIGSKIFAAYKKLSKRRIINFSIFTKFLIFAGKILVAVLSFKVFAYSAEMNSLIEILGNDNCSDRITSYILIEIHERLENIKKIYLSLIIAIVASLLLAIITYCINRKDIINFQNIPSAANKEDEKDHYELAQTSF